MEVPNIEPIPQFIHRLLAQLQDLHHAHLVRCRLSRHDDVTLYLCNNVALGHTCVCLHVADGFLSRPAPVMNTGIDDKAYGPEQFGNQTADIVGRCRHQPLFPGNSFSV